MNQNDELMDRYQELSDITEYPVNYAELWSRLAIDFAVAARYSMSAKCRHAAENYSMVKINDKPRRVIQKTVISNRAGRLVYLDVV